MPPVSNIPGSLATQTLLDARSDQLAAGVARSKPADSKLKSYANKFEAILIGKWLEEAEGSFAKMPGDDDDTDDPGHDQFRSLGLQFMAEGIASSGGLGISAMILKDLQKHHAKPHAIDNTMVKDGSVPPAAGASTKDYRGVSRR